VSEDPKEGQISKTHFTIVGKAGHVLIHINIEGLFEKVVVLTAEEMEDLIVLADAAVQESRMTEAQLAEQKAKNIKEMN
jgi:hypothetical protein